MPGQQIPPARLLAIADYGVLGGRLVEAAALAAQGGVGWLLLRAKGLDTAARVALARQVRDAAPGVFLSLHGDVAAAKASGCQGVHFSSAALAELPSAGGLIAGASCHDAGELAAARSYGAAYCFLSPVFATISKDSPIPPLGVERFGELARAAGLPVFALGGVRVETMEELAMAGAYGATVLGDLFLADDIRARASLIVSTCERIYGR